MTTGELDWDYVLSRYRDGAEVDSLPGGAKIRVSGADESHIHVKHTLWQASLQRSNLERGISMVASGQIPREASRFIDQYRTLVADERPTVAATVLKDLGYLQ